MNSVIFNDKNIMNSVRILNGSATMNTNFRE